MTQIICSRATLKMLTEKGFMTLEPSPGPLLAFNQIKITPSDIVPDRRWDERWIPPPGGRFFELTASDESWARPLGIGRVEKIDIGPYIVQFNERLMDKIYKSLNVPTELFATPEYSNSAGASYAAMRAMMASMRTN